jgi:hypothetical protein
MFILHVKSGGVVNFSQHFRASHSLGIIIVNILWCQKCLGSPVTYTALVQVVNAHLEIVFQYKNEGVYSSLQELLIWKTYKTEFDVAQKVCLALKEGMGRETSNQFEWRQINKSAAPGSI